MIPRGKRHNVQVAKRSFVSRKQLLFLIDRRQICFPPLSNRDELTRSLVPVATSCLRLTPVPQAKRSSAPRANDVCGCPHRQSYSVAANPSPRQSRLVRFLIQCHPLVRCRLRSNDSKISHTHHHRFRASPTGQQRLQTMLRRGGVWSASRFLILAMMFCGWGSSSLQCLLRSSMPML